MELELPADLARRLHLGREEFSQRLLTMLILRAPYPLWNTRSAVSPSGLSFLRRLYELSFEDPWPGNEITFVDELELPPRHDAEKGGAPDWAVFWDDQIWIIELKTEATSHRAAQIPSYFELAAHHFPKHSVSVTYLTPSGTRAVVTSPAQRYAHVVWGDVVPVVRSAWSKDSDERVRALMDGSCIVLENLDMPTSAWRSLVAGPVVAEQETVDRRDPIAYAMELAEFTSEDGQQRALDVDLANLEQLLELRLEIRNALASSPLGAPLRRVMPWLWQGAASGGHALTDNGERTGIELRLSRYAKPLYGTEES